MTDVYSPAKRSSIMRAVRSHGTRLELSLSDLLTSSGIKHRVQTRDLPGTPDIVLERIHVAIFAHGCFWHGHRNCLRGEPPKSRRAFWNAKLEMNRRRDASVARRLRRLGFHVITIWGCQMKDPNRVLDRLRSTVRSVRRGARGTRAARVK